MLRSGRGKQEPRDAAPKIGESPPKHGGKSMSIRRTALVLSASLLFVTGSQAQVGGRGPLAARIGHYMGDKATLHPGVHGGPGTMNYDALLDENSLSTNLI